MNKLLAALRSARKLELLVVLAALAVLLVLSLGTGGEGGASPDEKRLERILSRIDGAGQVRVMVSEDAQGTCSGAVVCCTGADDIAVYLQIQSAVRTLTGLDLDRIEIVRSGR